MTKEKARDDGETYESWLAAVVDHILLESGIRAWCYRWQPHISINIIIIVMYSHTFIATINFFNFDFI